MKKVVKCLSLLNIALLLSACAPSAHIRVADMTATNVALLNVSIDQYIKGLEQSAVRRLDYLAGQRMATASMDELLQKRIKLLEIIGDKKAQAFFTNIYSAHQIAGVERKEAQEKIDKGQEALKTSLAHYDEKSKNLSTLMVYLQSLSKSPDLNERARVLGGYIAAIQSQIEDVNKKAEQTDSAEE